jgi:hypothetical protein
MFDQTFILSCKMFKQAGFSFYIDIVPFYLGFSAQCFAQNQSLIPTASRI